MGLPEGDVCFAAELDVDLLLGFKLDLLGGANLSLKIEPGTIPDIGAAAMQLLAELNAALTPLVPLFNIIDAILAIFECIKAIPDSLGPPPDPIKLAKCIAKLAVKIDFLLKLIPQVSIALFIKGAVDVLVFALIGLRAQLAAIIRAQSKIDLGVARAGQLGGVALLEANLACAQVNLDLQLAVTFSSAQPLARLLGLLNLFLGLAQLPTLPDLSLDAAGGAEAALAPLDATIEAINGVKGLLPSLPSG